MSFLQPLILWGLPLALLPVLIHLFNRLRHRSVHWAAMMFLKSATRKSTRYARLRQFLILMFRVLAVVGLIIALGRPLAGGWMGWVFASTPDVILLLLDRSASMESRQVERSKRQEAAMLLADSAKNLQGSSRLILLDSATRLAQEIPNAAALPEISLAAPTDTAADLPNMLQSALDWLQQNKPGSAEIWIASDLQSSNWQPQSERWPALAGALAKLPQKVRVRLLALKSEPQANVSVSVLEVNRHQTPQGSELEIAMQLERNTSGPLTLPITINLDGAPSQVELKMDGASLRYHHKIPLDPKRVSGWGLVDLPADGNMRDNRSYFVYGPPPKLRAAVVSSDSQCGKILQLATAPDPKNTNVVCEVLGATALNPVIWEDYAMVLWQGALPEGETARRLRQFAEGGGVVMYFPPGEAGAAEGSGWGPVEKAAAGKPFRVSRWEEKEGPLAKTQEGQSLPVSDLAVVKRQPIQGEKVWLAAFDDGTPFLTRRPVGKGQVYFCATTPTKEWSDLYRGEVLVPMLQRLLDTGGKRFSLAGSAACGDWIPGGNDVWTAVDSATPKNIRTEAGVYRAAGQLVAVNRPVREDDNEYLETARARVLFGGLPTHTFEEKNGVAGTMQSELWRMFLFLMLLFLLVEAFLILPERQQKTLSHADLRPVESVEVAK